MSVSLNCLGHIVSTLTEVQFAGKLTGLRSCQILPRIVKVLQQAVPSRDSKFRFLYLSSAYDQRQVV